ncbi:MAG: hypothetical protein WCO35_02565 [Candidatus Nomurabacteria bacterium]
MQNKENFIKNIEDKIKDKKIKMKPKWHFVFKGILIISFVFILLLATIYIGNFILLIFHEHKIAFDAVNINPSIFKMFLEIMRTVPLLLLFLVSIFLFSLYKLVKDYSFVYRKNVLYVVLFLLFVVIVTILNIHVFLDQGYKMARFGERGEVPFLQNVHRYYRGPDLLKRIDGDDNNHNIPPFVNQIMNQGIR